MKTRLNRIISTLCIAIGLCLLGYPWISEYLFENRVDSVINTYEAEAKNTDDVKKDSILEMARQYNDQLSQAQVTLTDPFTKQETSADGLDYYSVLALDDSGLMGTIEIPKISVYLPIYHGTSPEVLESGIGHLEGSSLPVGGESTHVVLSGHTGLNSARLFTDLPELEEGDVFFLHILDEILAYEVCGINVVLPEDTSKLLVRDGEDLATLVTCTPYGVNSHRLCVTGKRTEYTEKAYEKTVARGSTESDSLWMRSYKRAVLIGLAIVMIFALLLFLFDRLMKKRRQPE